MSESSTDSDRFCSSRTARISQDLKTVLAVTRAMSLERDLNRLLDLIVSSASNLVKADRASLFLVDEERQELWTHIAQGTNEIHLPINTGIAGAVATSGEAINLADAYDDHRFNREHDQATGYRTRSILCLPLINHENRVIGVLQALNKRDESAIRSRATPEHSRFRRAVRTYERVIQSSETDRDKVIQSGFSLIGAAFEYGDFALCRQVISHFKRDQTLGTKEQARLATLEGRLTMTADANAVQPFSHHDEEVLAAFCAQAAVAIDNTQLIARDLERQQLLRDLELGRTIQEQLLPRVPPALPNWRLIAWHQSCDQVSGDYHDFLPNSNGNCDLVVGDVSGHGLGAALMMSTARAFLLGLHQHDQKLGVILEQLNTLLERDMADDAFMTMCLCRLGANGSCQWASAGHEAPLIYRADTRRCKQPEEETGLLLGALTESEYQQHSLPTLHRGDLLVVLTDGLQEAIDPRSGVEFGFDRVRNLIEAAGRDGAQAVLSALQSALKQHLDHQASTDDITISIAERL